MKGDTFSTKDVVHRFNPKQIHLVMPHEGTRFSISGFTMTDMSKLNPCDLDFLAQLEFPHYTASVETEAPALASHHTSEQVVWESSPEEKTQESATAHMASLIDYHRAPVATQLGLDKAMETEWQKYVEFNAVVPCSREENARVDSGRPHMHSYKVGLDRQERTLVGNTWVYTQMESTIGSLRQF